jgi:hypothetical protein
MNQRQVAPADSKEHPQTDSVRQQVEKVDNQNYRWKQELTGLWKIQ